MQPAQENHGALHRRASRRRRQWFPLERLPKESWIHPDRGRQRRYRKGLEARRRHMLPARVSRNEYAARPTASKFQGAVKGPCSPPVLQSAPLPILVLSPPVKGLVINRCLTPGGVCLLRWTRQAGITLFCTFCYLALLDYSAGLAPHHIRTAHSFTVPTRDGIGKPQSG